MIGVLVTSDQLPVVAEFFELFKTPWESYRHGAAYDVVIATTGEIPDEMPKLFISSGVAPSRNGVASGSGAATAPCVIAHGAARLPLYGAVTTVAAGQGWTDYLRAERGVIGVRAQASGSVLLTLGYDLFEEARLLLASGQPAELAELPALDTHIEMLRQWMLEAGVSVLEIPPAPTGHDFTVCLTHDIDFVGIRRHLFDHTMFGFLYRATIGTLRDALRGRTAFSRVLESWRAALTLPFVYLGLARDFWEPFEWYLETEKGLPSTYYLIPYKHRAGQAIDSRAQARRATAYDVSDIADTVATLRANGCEVGVHGLDAWHDASKGRDELARVQSVAGSGSAGIRMHWLLQDATTPAVLEKAGFAYDSTSGYNETIGYRNGTTQVFKPFTTVRLLELPMHIQDGALFYPQRLHLTEAEAARRSERMIGHVERTGGVLTLLWHDRSHGPERFWGEFYRTLVNRLRSSSAWFATGSQAVKWFERRRQVRFVRLSNGDTRVAIRYDGADVQPPLRVKVSRSALRGNPRGESTTLETSWNGRVAMQVDPMVGFVPVPSSSLATAASL